MNHDEWLKTEREYAAANEPQLLAHYRCGCNLACYCPPLLCSEHGMRLERTERREERKP